MAIVSKPKTGLYLLSCSALELNKLKLFTNQVLIIVGSERRNENKVNGLWNSRLAGGQFTTICSRHNKLAWVSTSMFSLPLTSEPCCTQGEPLTYLHCPSMIHTSNSHIYGTIPSLLTSPTFVFFTAARVSGAGWANLVYCSNSTVGMVCFKVCLMLGGHLRPWERNVDGVDN